MNAQIVILLLQAALFVSLSGCGKKAIEPKQQPGGPVKIEQFKAETKETPLKAR